MLPQARFLEFVAAEAERHPNFRLVMGARVKELVREEGQVLGIRYGGKGGLREVRATLTVGTDGRTGGFRGCEARGARAPQNLAADGRLLVQPAAQGGRP